MLYAGENRPASSSCTADQIPIDIDRRDLAIPTAIDRNRGLLDVAQDAQGAQLTGKLALEVTTGCLGSCPLDTQRVDPETKEQETSPILASPTTILPKSPETLTCPRSIPVTLIAPTFDLAITVDGQNLNG
ncbi:MAG: hypothetical protein QM773_00005, partial [Hyphomonadaceae bacterium]